MRDLLFFEHCEAIWGGSPATEEISCGIETGDNTVDLAEPQDALADVNLHSQPSSSSHGVDSTFCHKHPQATSAGKARSHIRGDRLCSFLVDPSCPTDPLCLSSARPTHQVTTSAYWTCSSAVMDCFDAADI